MDMHEEFRFPNPYNTGELLEAVADFVASAKGCAWDRHDGLAHTAWRRGEIIDLDPDGFLAQWCATLAA